MSLRSPYYQVIDGVRRSAIVQPEILRKALRFTPAKGDILQMSYPKCGTHWMQYLTLLVLNEGRPIRSYQEFVSSGRSLEYAGVEDWKPYNGVRTLPYRALMTHLDPPTKNRLNMNAKYVYVARNPWDCCVSFYHHVSNLSPFCFQDGTFDEFLASFLRGDFGYGDYFDHLLAGYALKEEPNVFFVTYEQLKRDVRSVVLKLAYFLGERYGRALETDKHLLSTLLERLTVESMRNVLVLDLAGKENPAMNGLFKGREVYANVGYQGDKRKYSFVRNGVVGGWRQCFSKSQLRNMEARITEKTSGSDVMDLWVDIVRETQDLMRDGE
ncbi:sulfotransferase 1B1-like [Dermacentor andersoni]|uniref:sulfotransferase 1B1-like n=1 Tax=Dermacentor andersoni TaxID=34620 RepID=UPI0024168E76|nr:sulfotransferase 1B1-like [Dermacentor andersoni]